MVLARVQNTAVFDGSILFPPQYSLALSYLYRSYSRYARELSIKGFDEEEVNAELNSLSLSLLIILSSAAAASIALYYVMASLKFLSVDPFTALIIASIFFIYIARYIINKVKGSIMYNFKLLGGIKDCSLGIPYRSKSTRILYSILYLLVPLKPSFAITLSLSPFCLPQ